MTTRAWIIRAAALFPSWPGARRRRWVRAARYAAHCVPAYARLLPMTQSDMPNVREQVFAARTLREAA